MDFFIFCGCLVFVAFILNWAISRDRIANIPEPNPNPYAGTFPYKFANSYVNNLHMKTPLDNPAELKLNITAQLTQTLIEIESPLIAIGESRQNRARFLKMEADKYDGIADMAELQGEHDKLVGASMTAMFLRSRAKDLESAAHK